MGRALAPSWVGPGLLILFVVPLLVYGAYSIGDRWYQNYALTHQEEVIRADVMRLRQENMRLQRKLNEAQNTVDMAEVRTRQIQRKLRKVEGEDGLKLIDDDEQLVLSAGD